MTEKYDMENPTHRRLKEDIAQGGGLLVIDDAESIIGALNSVGFEAMENRDLSMQTGLSIPWHQPPVGSGLSLASFRSSGVGRWLTHHTLIGLEALRAAARERWPYQTC